MYITLPFVRNGRKTIWSSITQTLVGFIHGTKGIFVSGKVLRNIDRFRSLGSNLWPGRKSQSSVVSEASVIVIFYVNKTLLTFHNAIIIIANIQPKFNTLVVLNCPYALLKLYKFNLSKAFCYSINLVCITSKMHVTIWIKTYNGFR